MKSHMNSQHPRITFTTKEEQNRSLLFMDVCFNRREDGKLMRQVYQKPTHTNRYVMFGSYHPMDVMFGSYPMDVKQGIVQGLAVIAMKVSSDEATRVKEFKCISYVMKHNGYLEKNYRKAIGKQVRRRSLDQAVPKGEATADEEMQTVRIPFIEGLSQEI